MNILDCLQNNLFINFGDISFFFHCIICTLSVHFFIMKRISFRQICTVLFLPYEYNVLVYTSTLYTSYKRNNKHTQITQIFISSCGCCEQFWTVSHCPIKVVRVLIYIVRNTHILTRILINTKTWPCWYSNFSNSLTIRAWFRIRFKILPQI